MKELLDLLRTFGTITLTPKGLTVFDPTDGDIAELTALATPLGYAVRLREQQLNADGSIKQYYDTKSNSMLDSKHMLQVGKPTEVSDDDATRHLSNL